MSTIYSRGLLVCLLVTGLASTQMAIAAPAQQGEGAKTDVAVPAGSPLSEAEIRLMGIPAISLHNSKSRLSKLASVKLVVPDSSRSRYHVSVAVKFEPA